ncbi:MAG: hypothetical protein KGI94_14715 [Paracoccaceae bacterium]|nr:hypothetical protein [Paracoccaceae bacterium]
MSEILDITPEPQRKPRNSGASGDPARPAHLQLVPLEHTPARAPQDPQSPILRAFRRLVAATCVASGAEAEAAGVGWDLSCEDWAAEAEAAWARVRELSAFVARQRSDDQEDASLVGAAWIIHAAVTCETVEHLFALREQMHVIRDVCTVAGRGGRVSAHVHLLAMSLGLMEDMCDRLLDQDAGTPDLDGNDVFTLL